MMGMKELIDNLFLGGGKETCDVAMGQLRRSSEYKSLACMLASSAVQIQFISDVANKFGHKNIGHKIDALANEAVELHQKIIVMSARELEYMVGEHEH